MSRDDVEDIEPVGTYRPQYHLRWRRLAAWLDFAPGLKGRLAGLARRGLTRIFEPGLVTTERVVEYPFVFQHLGRANGLVLDLGCCHSRLPIALASRGFPVIGMDFNPYAFAHPRLRTVRGDILHAPFGDDTVSAVLAISVIEHIGIGHYGDPTGTGADLSAVREIARVLRPGGRAIITVPFGRPLTNDWMRVYDAARLRALLAPLRVEEADYAVSRNGLWAPAAEEEAGTIDWTGPSRSVALVVASKPPAEKGED